MTTLRLATQVLVILALARTGALRAQSSFGIGGGVTMPAADLAAIDQPGYHLNALLEIRRPDARFGFRTDASYHTLSRTGTIRPVSDRFIALTAGPLLKAATLRGQPVYAAAGVGFYNRSTNPRPSGFASTLDAGFTAAIGARFRLAGTTAFGELRYHQIAVAGAPRLVPITVGVTF